MWFVLSGKRGWFRELQYLHADVQSSIQHKTNKACWWDYKLVQVIHIKLKKDVSIGMLVLES